MLVDVIERKRPSHLRVVLLAPPVVHVGAADVRQRDLDEHGPRLWIRDRVLADLEGLARAVEHRQPCRLGHRSLPPDNAWYRRADIGSHRGDEGNPSARGGSARSRRGPTMYASIGILHRHLIGGEPSSARCTSGSGPAQEGAFNMPVPASPKLEPSLTGGRSGSRVTLICRRRAWAIWSKAKPFSYLPPLPNRRFGKGDAGLIFFISS